MLLNVITKVFEQNITHSIALFGQKVNNAQKSYSKKAEF